MDLFQNKLTGGLPQTVGKLSECKHILLGNNQLSGSVPDSIGLMSRLEYLDLFNNNLTGTLPTTFRNLGALELVDLRNTTLRGMWPPDLVVKGCSAPSTMCSLPNAVGQCRGATVTAKCSANWPPEGSFNHLYNWP